MPSELGVMRTAMDSTDTIVAPSTGTVEAPVAIVRLSGPQAVAIFARMFSPISGADSAGLASHHLVFGTIVGVSGELIDQGLGVLMRAPHTFTGEDVAELHCHGGQAVVRSIVQTCVALGARPAEPGEFSRRAFLNGRMDLSQAEALCTLISARTEMERRVALRQLRGGLSRRIHAIRDELINVAAEIEARLDFTEDEVPPADHDTLLGRIGVSREQTEELLRGYERGRVVREGARVVIAGPPNAGKSSLFNALLGRERAIVTPHPGTTRDTIESTVEIGGLAVTLIDTAGQREATDEIERLGIARTNEEIQQADLVLQVEDAREARSARAGWEATRVVILNKADLLDEDGRHKAQQGAPGGLLVSARERSGLEQVEEAIAGRLGAGEQADVEVLAARQAECLRRCSVALTGAGKNLAEGASGEFVMIDLRDAIAALDELLGTRIDDEILDRVFSRFCIGK